MKVSITFNAPRWTPKNAEDFMNWIEKELMYREAALEDFLTDRKDLLKVRKLFKKEVYKTPGKKVK